MDLERQDRLVANDRTRIYVEHPSGERVLIHEGPRAPSDYELECDARMRELRAERGHAYGYIKMPRTRPVG